MPIPENATAVIVREVQGELAKRDRIRADERELLYATEIIAELKAAEARRASDAAASQNARDAAREARK